MFPPHIRTIDVVRSEHLNLAEVILAVVERDQFADNLRSAIGIARIQTVGNISGTFSVVGTVGGS